MSHIPHCWESHALAHIIICCEYSWALILPIGILSCPVHLFALIDTYLSLFLM